MNKTYYLNEYEKYSIYDPAEGGIYIERQTCVQSWSGTLKEINEQFNIRSKEIIEEYGVTFEKNGYISEKWQVNQGKDFLDISCGYIGEGYCIEINEYQPRNEEPYHYE